MRSITDLEAIIGPSRVPPPPVNWTLIEEGTGLVFPDDYKDWASRYSTLEFDEFLLVGHPGTFTDVLVGLLNGHVRCPMFGPEGLVGATVEEAGWIRES
ncbi:hypothetical protein [Streptosporangium sp. NPDC049376]|uniref:hypothetical protein n=1 Tax=Streptosporangium sp. NPDC049376 TaxID=3366192 RepID=UPI00378DF9B5